MSSVAPTESVSNQGNRSRPGKRERQAARSATGQSGGQPASQSKAAAFAQGVSDPVPQPGKFPVVFPTGAGEPTRDHNYAIPVPLFAGQLPSVVDKYRRNAKYAEFRAHSEFNDVNFAQHLSVSFLLRLAQHLVHSHVNMGLPQGDFAPLASSDVCIPQALASVVGQFGEFQSPIIGTRFLLKDYDHTVARCVLTAEQIWNGSDVSQALERSWLPMSPDDGNFKSIVAAKLRAFVNIADLTILPNVLEDAVNSGEVPEVWENIKPIFGDDPAIRDRFDFIFKRYNDVGQFTNAWTTENALSVLALLGLRWPNPQGGHLNWQFSTKHRFSSLADAWAKFSATYSQFFELSSGLSTRQAATGTHAQLATVTDVEGVIVVKAFIALSAPEFSLAACFPATCEFTGGVDRKVVVTTSVNVKQRATEFCQMDWR